MVVCSLITYTINHSRYYIQNSGTQERNKTQRSSCSPVLFGAICHLLLLSPSLWRRTKMLIFPLVGCSTLRNGKKVREHNTKHNHTTHNNQHEPQPPYPPAALPSLSPWVEQWHHQIMAPPLPDTIRRRRAVGLALAVVGLLAWGGEMRGIEK